MQSDEHKIEREKEFMRKKNAENSLWKEKKEKELRLKPKKWYP